jgi:release factor glutamine methyltransferase
MIFESLCGYTPTDILLHKDTILSEDIHRKIERITDRLSQQEPIQYILGYTDFCGRRFDIAPGALIPRPETEELTRLVITENSGQPSRIADLGTGSGCIAVTLALSLSDSKVEAWDISTEALEIAQRNARKHNAHVNFFQRDILRYDVSELPEESLDIIVSNPPYIPDGDIAGLDVSVRDYEPLTALKGGADGLDFYRAISEKWRAALHPGSRLFFEVGIGQADDVLRIMRAQGFGDIEIVPDTAGIPRVVYGTLYDSVFDNGES